MAYERVVIYRNWDGLIGPGSHTTEVALMRCDGCAALVSPGTEPQHDAFHDLINGIEREARRYKPAPRYGGS